MYYWLIYLVNNIVWLWCGKFFLDFRKLVSFRSVEFLFIFECLFFFCLYVIINGRLLVFCLEIYWLMLISYFFMFNIYLYFKGNSLRICDFECSLYFCDEEIG